MNNEQWIMNNYLLTPWGSPHKTYKPYKPLLPPLGGTEGDSNIIYNVAMNAKKQPPGIALLSFLRNSGSAEVTCTRQ